MAYFDEPSVKKSKKRQHEGTSLFEDMGEVFRPCPIPSVNPNSVESFYDPMTQVKRNTQKAKCLEAIKMFGKCSQNKISESTGIPRHLVPDRLIQLERMDLIERCGSEIDQHTKAKVTLYKIKQRKAN